jgi:hypothetical protein
MLDLSKEKLNLSYVIMENSVIKYRTLIERIILFCYLLIFSLDILHFHNYDFNRISAFDIANDTNNKTQVSKSEFVCIVHQNFLSLQTAIPNSPVINLNDREHLVRRTEIIRTYLNRIYPSINHLRAPPFFS